MAPHTGRYQSQLLNFLNRQSQKLQDRTELLWRHLQLAAVWGTQLLLYPIYAIFQAARIAGRQMGYQLQQFLAPATVTASEEMPSDFAIQRVMAVFAPTPPADDPVAALSFPLRQLRLLKRRAQPPIVDVSLPPIAVRGVASCLHTRHLVLVSTDNLTHDLLTCDQQHQLQQRILWEIANYWYLWRQYLWRKQYVAGRPEALARLRHANWLPPMRWFWQLMVWLQCGPVANRLNLFHEVNLMASPNLGWFQPSLGQLPTDALAVRFGAISGIWETLPEGDRISRLIRAAIRYFLGQPPQAAVGNWDAAAELPQAVPTLMQDAWLDDPWLAPMDLHSPETEVRATPAVASPTLVLEVPSQPESLPSLPEWPSLPPASWRDRVSQLVQTLVGRLTDRDRPVFPSFAATSAAAAGYLNPPETEGANSLAWQQPSRSAATTTWIDALATPIGYVKHPLEQLLDGIDRGLTWLEQQLSEIWHRLQTWWVTKQARIKDTIRKFIQR